MKRIEKENAIVAYKGFDKNLCCRGYQYEVGKEYHADGDIKACGNGFHACPNPNDLFAYYAPNDSNRYCKVRLWGDVDDSESDKIAASDIEIIEEMSIMEVANAKRIYTETNAEDKECNTGNCSSASNTGDRSLAEVSGKASCAAVFGKDSKVRGAIGCALFLVERGDWDDENEVYSIINVLAVIVDGEEIKADTWYKLVNGKLVEVEE